MAGLILAVFAIGSMLLAACARPGTATTPTGGATPTSSGGGSSSCANGTVHTLASSFQESCVNVAKGSSLTIMPVVTTTIHIFSNGTYANGVPQPAVEPGAPTVSSLQETSKPVTIGPFTTAGTFHIYCSVHPNMDLVINVK
jgi:plastocyanin